jgi:hypothetical protein
MSFPREAVELWEAVSGKTRVRRVPHTFVVSNVWQMCRPLYGSPTHSKRWNEWGARPISTGATFIGGMECAAPEGAREELKGSAYPGLPSWAIDCFALRATQGLPSSAIDCFAWGLRRNHPDDATVVRATLLGGAVEGAVGVDGHIATGKSSVTTAGKVVQ